jgi:hypothetical protein
LVAAITTHFASTSGLQTEKPLMPQLQLVVSLLQRGEVFRDANTTIKFKRLRRALSYNEVHKNEVLQLVASRTADEHGVKPSVETIISAYESQNPGISIPASTISGLARKGYDGKLKLAPRLGGKTRIPWEMEREMAWHVSV